MNFFILDKKFSGAKKIAPLFYILMRKIRLILFILVPILILFFLNYINIFHFLKKNKYESLLIITIDTWRWDYIGLSEMSKVKTPFLDSLGKDGLYIKEAIAPCPLTTPSHATIFTGKSPLEHGIIDCTSYSLKENIETLAEIFRDSGFKTAAFVSSATLNRKYGLNKGFQIYDDSLDFHKSDEIGGGAKRDGADTLKAVIKYLEESDNKVRLFLWIHFFDLHKPYYFRELESKYYPNDPYAAQVLYVDKLVEKLVKNILNEKYRRWKIVIVGDHGEGLGDKNEEEHGIGLYRSTINVPLIFYPKPKFLKDLYLNYTLDDIFSICLEWLNIKEKTTSFYSNRNIKKDRVIHYFSVLPTLLFGVNPILGIRMGKWVYIKHESEELYDIEKDPEQNVDCKNDINAYNELIKLRKICDKIFHPNVIHKILKPTISLSKDEEKKLRSLGYLTSIRKENYTFQKANLKDILEDWKILKNIRENIEISDAEKEKIYAYLNNKYSLSATIAKDYGIFLVKNKRYEEALKIFEKAVSNNENDIGLLSNLGVLYSILGKHEEAKKCFLSALRIDDGNVIVHKNLGNLYANIFNDSKSAIKHYKKVLELNPQDIEKERLHKYIYENQ